MGDGSAVMQSAMLLSAAAGNGVQNADGGQSLGANLAAKAAHGSPAQSEDRAMGSLHASDTGWTLNGYNPHPPDPGHIRHQQQQQASQQFQFPQSTLQHQRLQFEFPSSLQQQVHPTQAQLDAQMAQLHGTFAHLQQQSAGQWPQLAAGSGGSAAQNHRASGDGRWPGSTTSQLQQHVPHQQLPQQQHGAISALRQGLLLQQQQVQQQQDRSPLGELLHDGLHHKQTSTVSVPQALHAGPAPSASMQTSKTYSQQHEIHSRYSSSAPAIADGSLAQQISSSQHSNGSTGKDLASGPPSSNLTVRLTVQLVATYSKCTPPGADSGAVGGAVSQPLPHRVLTKPGAGVKNDGWDNESSDLVLSTQDVLVNAAGHRYVVLDMLGSGTFGQVVSCYSETEGKAVAVKVIKNQPAYYHQARVEVGILQLLNGRCDPHDRHHIVRLQDAFLHKRHLCLAFEQLGINLFELLKRNGFRGLSLGLLRLFLQQILDALIVLRDASIIHCDLKPENILLTPPAASGGALGQLKLIDFGSACFEHRTVYSYIQSRFYRSPEVMLGLSYSSSIDMWSFGCVAAELFLGLPLFPGASEHDLLNRIMETLGPPPAWMMAAAKRTSAFFKKVPSTAANGSSGNGVDAGDGSRYVLYSKEEFEAANNCQAPAGKRYFSHTRLADIVGHYPSKQGATDAEEALERRQREALLDLLIGVLDLDPKTRWTPRQAIKHPFITGEPFTGPYQPAADSHPQQVHHHHHRHLRHQQQSAAVPATPEQQQQQQFAVAAAAAAAAASAAGSFSGTEHHIGSFGGSLNPGSFTARTGPVAMQACSAAHNQQQQYAAAAAAGMLQATPSSSFLGPSSFPTAGAGSYMAGSTGQLLQYSPAAAQVHARAHAIAMAALQQLSPQLGSSFQTASAAQLLGSSVSNRGTGSYIAPGGMSIMQQQQPQQQQLSSSYSPARPLIPSGRTAGSAQQQLMRQQQRLSATGVELTGQQQVPTAMVTSPAPQSHGQQGAVSAGMQGTVFGTSSMRAANMGAAGAAVAEYLSSTNNLAQSFNHNLLMSPVSPAHINNVAAMLAAARQQQQQQQQQAAAVASSLAMAGSIPRGASLQQRWRAAMEQHVGQGAAGINMQFGQQQQQQPMYPQGASWQQGPAVGLLGQSVAPAVDSNIMLQLQQRQQAQRQQSVAAAAAAAALAAKAAASAGAGYAGTSAGAGSLQGSARLSNALGSQMVPESRESSGDGLGSAAQRSRHVRNSSSGGNLANRSGGRVSSADDVMFAMEEGPGSDGSSRQQLADEQQQRLGPAAAAAAYLATATAGISSMAAAMGPQHVLQLARPELIASSPLELSPIEEQQLAGAGDGRTQQRAAAASLQAVAAVAPAVLHQQQHPVSDDLELQEEEVMCEEHPGDWNPLYTDEQLLDEQASPSPKAPAATAAVPQGRGAGLFTTHPGHLVEAALGIAGNVRGDRGTAATGHTGGTSQGRSRRSSIVHVRSMSVEVPELGEDVLEPGLANAATAEVGMDVVRPSVAGGSNGGTPDEELDVTLGPHWSFRPPAHLLNNPVHPQQQQQQQATQSALLWSGGSLAGPAVPGSQLLAGGLSGNVVLGSSAIDVVGPSGGLAGQHQGFVTRMAPAGVSCDTGLGLLGSPDPQAGLAVGSDNQFNYLGAHVNKGGT